MVLLAWTARVRGAREVTDRNGCNVARCIASVHRRSPRRHAVPRFATRFKVRNLRFGFHQCPNPNISMGFRSGDLVDRTLNPRLGSGPNPVLEVREPDRSQSNYKCILMRITY
jgi:hypothetical protein